MKSVDTLNPLKFLLVIGLIIIGCIMTAKIYQELKKEWESSCFVEKTHWGYYTWPRNMVVYAGVEEQPKLGRSREDLTEKTEKEKINLILDVFASLRVYSETLMMPFCQF